MVRTKIVATLGPASGSETVLRKMIENGLAAARLNFSHGVERDHIRMIKLVRSLNQKMHRAVKIMQDLEGYRIRIGKLKGPIALKKHYEFFMTQETMLGTEKEVSFDYAGSLKAIKKGALIYIDDGRIALEVKGVEKKRLKVRVLAGGLLKDHKGINILGSKLDFEGLTQKDKHDARIAIEYKLDYVAQSFVRNAGDLRMLKSIIKPKWPECQVIAKIENQEALKNLDDIISESDGVMVARGDLGICVPIYKVPVIQKEIIKRARQRSKPVIVATQMLESMTENRLPTRAEVSDVANAVLDGATHVMLSGETAVGQFPAETIDMMHKIIKNTEQYEALEGEILS
jgi:pyruvate kinase